MPMYFAMLIAWLSIACPVTFMRSAAVVFVSAPADFWTIDRQEREVSRAGAHLVAKVLQARAAPHPTFSRRLAAVARVVRSIGPKASRVS